ncbi:MAG: DUF4843 domain-containing protein [Bacteroides sp.]|nr:DUF4843 domain-containing protein [Bacteroides sp.]
MNHNIYAGIALGVLAAVFATSCTEDDYKLYDTTQKDSVFFEYRNTSNELVDEIEYNYNYDIATVHTIEIPVTLMGVPKDYDRTIEVIQLTEPLKKENPIEGQDSLVYRPMTEGINFTLTDNIIPAGEVGGTIRINLLRDKDPEILTEQKSLILTIGENDDLRSVGENKIIILYSDIRPSVRPDWWPDYRPLPIYSFENAQWFFQYFYDRAPKADINLYNEMISRYGDYFVNAQRVGGPFAYYSDFLRNYVLIPLYKEHPEIGWDETNLPTW